MLIEVMGGLCEMYVDPTTGTNRCKELQQDRRCGLDNMHAQIVLALAEETDMPESQEAVEAAKGLCECSCWADIVDVYEPMFAQV